MNHGSDGYVRTDGPLEAYLERVDLYIRANKIANEDRGPVFLSIVGGKTYTLLRDVLAPDTLSDKSLSELKEALKRHYQPKRMVIAERFRFHRRNQGVGESIVEFVAKLRKLAKTCKFGAYLDQPLRDQFVCSLRNEAVQRRLLTKPDTLTFARAVEVAEGMEAAEINTQQWKGAEAMVQVVTRAKDAEQPCYRCGRSNYPPAECHFRDATCHFCGRKGHISRVCRSRKAAEQPAAGRRQLERKDRGVRQQRTTKWMQLESSGEKNEPEELPLFQIGARSSHPITVEIMVNNKTLEMELDTGAAVSIISEEARQKLFSGVPLQKSPVALRIYTGEPMEVKGQLKGSEA